MSRRATQLCVCVVLVWPLFNRILRNSIIIPNRIGSVHLVSLSLPFSFPLCLPAAHSHRYPLAALQIARRVLCVPLSVSLSFSLTLSQWAGVILTAVHLPSVPGAADPASSSTSLFNLECCFRLQCVDFYSASLSLASFSPPILCLCVRLHLFFICVFLLSSLLPFVGNGTRRCLD